MLRKSGYSTGWYFYLIFLALFFITCNNAFFWDTIHLASMQANWYYENNFSQFILPPEFDSGHPPLLGLLLAGWWKLFRPTLFYSHLLMLPFVLLMVNQVLRLCAFLFEQSIAPLAAALILFNTILMGQSALVSPDLVLYCFFFFTLDGIFRKTKWKILLGALLLSAISMRGMMCVMTLFIFQFILIWKEKEDFSISSIFKLGLLYLPSALLGLAFLYVHYDQTGWVGYHRDSPWSPSYQQVGASGVFRNLLVLAWRFIDLGNAFIWLILGGAMVFMKGKKNVFSNRSGYFLILFIIALIILVIPQLFYRQLLAHRYLLPVMAIVTLLMFSLAEENFPVKTLKKLGAIVIVGMLSGLFWVYPDNFSKGWDSTLAHLPYYSLRKQALDYLKINGIKLTQVGAAFPYNEPSSVLDLSTDTTRFAEKNLLENRYVLYSNIANDFTSEELTTLKTKWITVHEFGNWPVRFVLFRNPSLHDNVISRNKSNFGKLAD